MNDDAFLYREEHGDIEEPDSLPLVNIADPMTDELKPCPICHELPDLEQLNVSIWIVKHEISDDHIVRVTGKTCKEAIQKWNNQYNSGELIKMIQLRIDYLEEQIEENCTYRSRDLVIHEIITLKWVLSLRKEGE